MRTVKQLVDIVTYLTGEPRGRVTQFARRLTEDGLLPKSIGRDIKNVDSSSAFLPVFAIAFAKRAADASAVAKEIADLPLLTGTTDLSLMRVIGPDARDVQKDPIAKQIGIHVGLPLADVLGKFLASDTVLECHLTLTRGDAGRYGAELSVRKEYVSRLPDGSTVFESADWFWLIFGHDHANVGFTWHSFTLGAQGFRSMRTLFRAKDPPNRLDFTDTAKDGGGDG